MPESALHSSGWPAAALAAGAALLCGCGSKSFSNPAAPVVTAVPAGRGIVFSDCVDIWVLDPDTGDRKRLTENAGKNYWPAWSPDGTKIVFQSNRADDSFQIFIMNADGSQPTQITRASDPINYSFHPAWSPDGQYLLVESGRPSSTDAFDLDLRLITPQGDHVKWLTDTPGREWNGEWSPDGGRIVFEAEDHGFFKTLFVMNADGTNRTWLTEGYSASSPSWSPDGSRILFQGDPGTGYSLYSVRPDGSDLRMHFPDEPEAKLYGTWSPDGKRIAYLGWIDESITLAVANADGTGIRSLNAYMMGYNPPDWR